MALRRRNGDRGDAVIDERGPIIGDPGFIPKLRDILGVPRGQASYPQVVDQLGIVIAIDGGQVLSGAARLSVASITDELVQSDTELVLGPILQGANAVQLNNDLTAALNAGDSYELLGMTVWARLHNPAAADQARVSMYVDEVVRSVFPVAGSKIIGGLLRAELYLAQPDKLTDTQTFLFNGTRRGKVLSTSAGRVLQHATVFNIRTAAGAINVGLGGAVYFRLLT